MTSRFSRSRSTSTITRRAWIEWPVGRSSPVHTTRPRGGRSGCCVRSARRAAREGGRASVLLWEIGAKPAPRGAVADASDDPLRALLQLLLGARVGVRGVVVDHG